MTRGWAEMRKRACLPSAVILKSTVCLHVIASKVAPASVIARLMQSGEAVWR